MKRSVMLTITSLLSIVLLTLHISDDIVHGMESGTAENLAAIPILVVWLYGTLLLSGRNSGYVIMLLGGLFALGMPLIHLRGAGVGGEFAKSGGALLFIFTLFMLGVTGTFSIVTSARAIWNPKWSESRIV